MAHSDDLGEAGPQFAERLDARRHELRYSREELVALTGVSGECVSLSTVKNMENTRKRYSLPRIKSSKHRPMPLELVATALDVPLGYFLGGFSPEEIAASHYGPAVAAGRIQIVHVLRPPDKTKESLDMFTSQLPTDEDAIFQLPLYSFQNERALAVIFAIEKIYCGFEMLIVNEPPFVLWDDDDISGWASSMGLNGEDSTVFMREFVQYRAYFRTLIETDRKNYKVVVNYPTLRRFLDRKGATARAAWIEDAVRLLRYPNFNLILHRPAVGQGNSQDGGVNECEVLCKTREIPISLEGMVACQILQTPPHVKPTSYIISPAPRDVVMVQREMSRVDTAWAEALSQYQEELGSSPGSPGLGEDVVRTHTAHLVRSL